jgi:hypothetical protein
MTLPLVSCHIPAQHFTTSRALASAGAAGPDRMPTQCMLAVGWQHLAQMRVLSADQHVGGGGSIPGTLTASP